jgi:hypothetical protein
MDNITIMIELQYNIPVEVTKEQLRLMMKKFSGIIAGREDQESGKCYIKLWMMRYKHNVEAYLNQNLL